MNENDVIELYGKSIWDMSAVELIDNGLVELWVKLVEDNI